MALLLLSLDSVLVPSTLLLVSFPLDLPDPLRRPYDKEVDITLILAVRRAEAQDMLDLVKNTIASRAGTKGTLGVLVVSAGLTDGDVPQQDLSAGSEAQRKTQP
ncbi:uncharacterized protein UHOD_11312 [Ustilago sp. UG-2017b]|nr:uncharacterized protein UHOD_11312 [Ustilago sp. UG-2017b]